MISRTLTHTHTHTHVRPAWLHLLRRRLHEQDAGQARGGDAQAQRTDDAASRACVLCMHACVCDLSVSDSLLLASSSSMIALLPSLTHNRSFFSARTQEDAVAYLSTLPARRLPGCGWSTNQLLKVKRYRRTRAHAWNRAGWVLAPGSLPPPHYALLSHVYLFVCLFDYGVVNNASMH